MKVLLVHNDYGAYSGEEAVVDKMAVMLASRGAEVAQLRMSTAGVRDSLSGQIRGFLNGIYSPSGVHAMREAINREKPDVVNVHNLYPFISPAALRECKKAGVPVVMTVHNFRLICPTGLFMRDGVPCEECLDKRNEWGCLRHNCEGSLLKSLGYTLRNVAARWRRDYKDCVTRFACITDFQRQKLIQAGFDPGKIIVIPNSVNCNDSANPQRAEYVAYLGRLSYEKGFDQLIAAAKTLPDIKFRIAGAARQGDVVADIPSNVELLGYVTGQTLSDFIANAAFIVMPSRCYEGFPMAILEAAQFSKPAIGPDHGGFTEIIGKGADAIGRLFRPGDVNDLSAHIRELWDIPTLTQKLGEKARRKLLTQYSSDVIADRWMTLLNSLCK